MRWALTVITPPAEEPVDLQTAKSHLRVDHADEDARIAALIQAAREWCEAFQGRAYVTQQLRLHLERWPRAFGTSNGRLIWLPRPQLQSVQAIRYTLEDGTQQTLPASSYLVQTAHEPGAVVLAPDADWPSDSLQPGLPIQVDFTAGYGAASAVPERVKQAILLHVGLHYENRGDGLQAVTLPEAIEKAIGRLLWQERVFYSGPE